MREGATIQRFRKLLRPGQFSFKGGILERGPEIQRPHRKEIKMEATSLDTVELPKSAS